MSTGVIYQQRDYVGLGRRVCIIVLDLLTLLMAGYAIGFLQTLLMSAGVDLPEADRYGFVIWCLLSYFYLVVLRKTRFRSIGLRLCRAKIVDYRGQPPSLLAMTFRVLLLVASPFSFVLDWFWLCHDKHKQTLRDKFSGTYVVNSQAQPVQRGHLQSRYYTIMGTIVPFWELSPDAAPVAENSLLSTSDV